MDLHPQPSSTYSSVDHVVSTFLFPLNPYIVWLNIFGQWRAFLDPEGRIMDSKALRKKIFYGGVDHALRKEVLYLTPDLR